MHKCIWGLVKCISGSIWCLAKLVLNPAFNVHHTDTAGHATFRSLLHCIAASPTDLMPPADYLLHVRGLDFFSDHDRHRHTCTAHFPRWVSGDSVSSHPLQPHSTRPRHEICSMTGQTFVQMCQPLYLVAQGVANELCLCHSTPQSDGSCSPQWVEAPAWTNTCTALDDIQNGAILSVIGQILIFLSMLCMYGLVISDTRRLSTIIEVSQACESNDQCCCIFAV